LTATVTRKQPFNTRTSKARDGEAIAMQIDDTQQEVIAIAQYAIAPGRLAFAPGSSWTADTGAEARWMEHSCVNKIVAWESFSHTRQLARASD